MLGDMDADDDEDVAPLLPDSELMVEQLRNELEGDLTIGNTYERRYSPFTQMNET